MRLFGRRKPVAVLGAGPAGLLAAYAAREQGYEPIILSRPGDTPERPVAMSELHGCQYLHAPVPLPALAGTSVMVGYHLRGDANEYRHKVYGGSWQGNVSTDDLEETHQAWDLRAVYAYLWADLAAYMRPMNLNRAVMANILSEDWHRVFVTVPAPALCAADHGFHYQQVWAMGQRTGSTGFPFQCPENTIICDGTREVGWYRMANVFGHTTVEWSRDRKPPISGVAQVKKPLHTDCDCWTQDHRVRRLGRFGRWEKGVLVHQAYYAVKRELA